MNKAWTKNSINRLLVKFRTVDRRPDSGRRSARTDKNVDTVESLLLNLKTNLRATKQSEKFHVRRGNLTIISFVDYSQCSASQVLQEEARSTAD